MRAALYARYSLEKQSGASIEDQHRVCGRGTGQIEIDEAQAAIVRRIFERYADGKAPRAIADELNRDEVPAPGSGWARTERRQVGWVHSALNGDGKATGILHNPMYRG